MTCVNSTVIAIELASELERLQDQLRFMAHWGLAGFDCKARTLEILQHWGTAPQSPSAVASPGPALPEADAETLPEIRDDLGECMRCRLHQSRQHIVFGTGNPRARLVFVGEGPGAEEDRQAEPFVGAAGQLLNRIIEAIHLKRSDVYICNVIKCRPPHNRNPQPDEVATCMPFLERQLAAIKPDFICALGKFAAQSLLKSDAPISKLRGRMHRYRGIPVVPTYHPAYLLRNPERKRDVWEDMKRLMRAMAHLAQDKPA